jgi:hypothetical protein
MVYYRWFLLFEVFVYGLAILLVSLTDIVFLGRVRFKLHETESYIDCGVDGDDDSDTCISNKSISNVGSFGLLEMVQSLFILSLLDCVGQLYLGHESARGRSATRLFPIPSHVVLLYLTVVVAGTTEVYQQSAYMYLTLVEKIAVALFSSWSVTIFADLTSLFVLLSVGLALGSYLGNSTGAPLFILLLYSNTCVFCVCEKYFHYRFYHVMVRRYAQGLPLDESHGFFAKKGGMRLEEIGDLALLEKHAPDILLWERLVSRGISLAWKLCSLFILSFGVPSKSITYF